MKRSFWRWPARPTAPAPTPESALLRRTAIRLGLQAALIVAAVVAVLVGVALVVVLRSQHQAADALLVNAVQRAEDADDPPAGMWLVLQNADGREITKGLPAGVFDGTTLARTARTGVAEAHELQVAGRDYRIQTVRRGATTIEGILDLRSANAERQQLVMALGLVGVIGLVLAAGAGALLGVRAVQPLATALSLQRRFVSDASHELRTPLTLLTTRAQLLRRHLQRGRDPDKALADVENLVTDSDHLTAILEDLLLAADPRSTQGAEPIDLSLLASGVVTASTAAAHARSVSLTMVDGGAVYVEGTPVALRRAVTALVDNAIRHAQHAVTVTVTTNDRDAVLEVSDDGPGIDPVLAPRLFERFASSGGASPDGRRRRYGIGLALVGEIVAQHHGQIAADGDPGSSTTFRITLPAVAAPTPAPLPEPEADARP
ncbi:sensor histidine kinase [Actinopolymorpha alba]|uniref:sensor histidine kinase n=1 Tax=Actinopolymorpha alba TaxID=533267 RepID=UPI00036D588A|nr:HAMP domain-containing sensor histidine kinase [Actinopolymorpha alba]